jgi:hypothetical protein
MSVLPSLTCGPAPEPWLLGTVAGRAGDRQPWMHGTVGCAGLLRAGRLALAGRAKGCVAQSTAASSGGGQVGGGCARSHSTWRAGLRLLVNGASAHRRARLTCTSRSTWWSVGLAESTAPMGTPCRERCRAAPRRRSQFPRQLASATGEEAKASSYTVRHYLHPKRRAGDDAGCLRGARAGS